MFWDKTCKPSIILMAGGAQVRAWHEVDNRREWVATHRPPHPADRREAEIGVVISR